ncbi:MAG: recombination protein RecA, partial [Actinomycetota bacterium]|nr:recombination protein RecA [Actinomycetota bacterium]
LGMLMGAGWLARADDLYGAGLEWWDDHDSSYGFWKLSLFPGLGATIRSRYDAYEEGGPEFRMPPLAELVELQESVQICGAKVFSYDYLKRVTPLSLALWYMDTGVLTSRGEVVLSVEGWEEATRQRVAHHLADTWSIKAKLMKRSGRTALVVPKDQAIKFQELVAPYVHPSMDHNLEPRLRGLFNVKPPKPVASHYELMPLPIVAIDSKAPSCESHRYDIEVEGSHNYFVDGVMVHNSPETTPGGRALKFYASVRLDIRKIENIKNGQEVTGSRVRVKVVKSKVSAPFRQAEFDIQYGHGISKEGSLLDTAAERGIVMKSGSWYLFDGDQIGQGRENAKAFLAEHPDVCDEIATRVKKAVGLVAGGEGEAEVEEKAPVFTVVP